MSYTERKCDYCGALYMAWNGNLKKGWGLCCSKKCGAKKREEKKRIKSGNNQKKQDQIKFEILKDDLLSGVQFKGVGWYTINKPEKGERIIFLDGEFRSYKTLDSYAKRIGRLINKKK